MLSMMNLKGTWSIAGLPFGFIILVPYVSTYYLATMPSSAYAAIPHSFLLEPMEYSQANLERTLPAPLHIIHQPPVYALPAPAPPPMPSSTCTGFQKLAHESMWPWFQYLRCASSMHPGCEHVACHSPYTQTSHGSLCGCVIPIQVQLTLDVPLDALFQAIPMLVKDIALGVLLMENQARIVGLNEDSDDQTKSTVEIDLVPLGNMFDNATVSMIFKKFQDHEVLARNSLVRNYTVVYIRYPASFPSVTNSGVLPRAGLYPHQKPLSVDVSRRNEKINVGTIAVVVVSSTIAVVAIFGGLFMVVFKINNVVKAPSTTKSSPMSECRRPEFIAPTVTSFCLSARKFSKYELERATENFDTKNVLGQGGSGQVFRGKLEDGSNIAVKVITGVDQQRANEFIAEVEMLCRLHHRNLVKLIGVCIEEPHYCLVYELISNGSVESHLHNTAQEAVRLDWNTRLKIALGAARGLAYLHEDANPCVIHRDFKASNILLEEDFTPKISDFGLAKAAPDEENGHISPTVMGTFGYVAPEYAMTGHLLVKSDVYSYGVVLLELLSGRKAIDLSQPAGGESLVTWARCLLASEDGVERLLDPALEGHVSLDIFGRVAAIALMCVQPDVSHRPFMGEIVQALKLVCNCGEGSSSVTISPQDSGGESDRVCCSSSEPINISSNTSCISLDYDSGTACAVKRANMKCVSPVTASLNSDQSLDESSNIFRRHSISGPCTAVLKSTWSSERPYIHIIMSENRMMRPSICSSSEPINISNKPSLDFVSSTVCAAERANMKHQLPLTIASNSDQSLDESSNIFRRHSISGPCTAWSSEKPYTQITMNENRMIRPYIYCSSDSNISNTTSLNYVSGTTCAVKRADLKRESPVTISSYSDRSLHESRDIFRRHSISGPCTAWSSEKPYTQITMSENRIMWPSVCSTSEPISISSNTPLDYVSGTACAVKRGNMQRELPFTGSSYSGRSLHESSNIFRRHSISDPCAAYSFGRPYSQIIMSENRIMRPSVCFNSEPISIWSNHSLDYDSGTACVVERENMKCELPSIVSSNSDRYLDESANIFRRHSISGPCTAVLNSCWSSETGCTQITMSENRIWFSGPS